MSLYSFDIIIISMLILYTSLIRLILLLSKFISYIYAISYILLIIRGK
jgi:hypothetical protein